MANEQPWAAEHVVDERLARELLKAQFPQLACGVIRPLGVGWDNTAFLVDDVWVFRFPRRPIAVPLIEREVRLLPQVARRLPVAVPVPVHVGSPGADYPWPFAGYRMIDGVTACRASLSPEQRAALAPALARVLAALHAFPADEALGLGAGGDELGRLDVQARAPAVRAALGQLHERGVIAPERIQVLQRLLEPPAAAAEPAPVLVHGDLYARHLLIDGAGSLCGIIDWGDIHLGRRAVDLAVVFGFLPLAAREHFWRAYGTPDPAELKLARFRALNHTVMLLRYAHEIGDADLLREALLALGWLDVE